MDKNCEDLEGIRYLQVIWRYNERKLASSNMIVVHCRAIWYIVCDLETSESIFVRL